MECVGKWLIKWSMLDIYEYLWYLDRLAFGLLTRNQIQNNNSMSVATNWNKSKKKIDVLLK